MYSILSHLKGRLTAHHTMFLLPLHSTFSLKKTSLKFATELRRMCEAVKGCNCAYIFKLKTASHARCNKGRRFLRPIHMIVQGSGGTAECAHFSHFFASLPDFPVGSILLWSSHNCQTSLLKWVMVSVCLWSSDQFYGRAFRL